MADRGQEETNFRMIEAVIARAAEGICVCHNIEQFPFVRFTLWNDQMTRISGYSLEEINRLGWYQAMYPDPEVQARAAARMATMRQGDDILSEEWTITRADGQRRVVSISTAILFADEANARTYVIAFMRDVTDQKQAETELQKLASVVRFSSELINLATLEGRMTFLNEAGSRLLGIDPGEVASTNIMQVIPDHLKALVETELLPALAHGGTWEGDLQYLNRKTGRLIDVHAMTFTIKDPASGAPQYLANVSLDLTERKRLESQLMQLQKMEAVGRLAGGVAHDFNNNLCVILNLADLVEKSLPPGDPLQAQLRMIKGAAEQAASMTRQLLAFSRKQVIEPRIVDLNALLSRVKGMLGRLIGEDVDLVILGAEGLGFVRVDEVQMEQVLMNLAVNARDAMPDGGRLTIETANVALGDEYARAHPSVSPGPHVMLAVSDTGTGMDRETLSHIFEPFFTTKDRGQGTGMGLSIVYGIVAQCQGSIGVYSEPGVGTTFKIYLPRAGEALEARPERSPKGREDRTGTETILVVEDDAGVRRTTRMILEESGYRVLDAASGDEALRTFIDHRTAVGMVITDVIMPGLSCKELTARLSALKPDLKILYVSGYTDNVITRHGILDPGTNFLQKPYTLDGLLQKVRDVLDSKRR